MEFKVFWCKVNKYYTEEWLKSEYLKDKDGIFIASCVVTDKAKRKWIKFVKDTYKELKNEEKEWKKENSINNFWNSLRLSESQSLIGSVFERKEKNIYWINLEKKIYISWCWAFKKWEVQEDFFEIYPELKKFSDKIVILWEKSDELKENRKKEIKNIDFSKLPKIYTKKFLLIQGWCDSFCSFCLTVQKRWRHYFRSKEDIVSEILEFEKSGWKEVVLTGINLSAWWLPSTNLQKILKDKDKVEYSKFAELLDYILKHTKIPRIRISSIWPEFIDKKCLELFKEIRIYPHFHYSVQSGSTEVLKNTRRHYDWDFIKNLLKKTKKLKREDGVEVSIWADLIVWFPGESEKDFEKTYSLVEKWLITKIHAFPFSAHNFWEWVPAWRFENQIDEKIKKDRMWKIEAKADEIRERFIEKNIWKKFKVLIEVVKKDEETWKIKWKGWTENYIEATEKTFEILEWKIERNNIVLGILK